jgi:hypothetical protein
MLTADEAADAAARHGLSIADAASLRQLADTPDEADALAARFADGADPVRAWSRALFRDAEAPAPVPAPAPAPTPGAVPREGANAQPAETGERALRSFVRALFR